MAIGGGLDSSLYSQLANYSPTAYAANNRILESQAGAAPEMARQAIEEGKQKIQAGALALQLQQQQLTDANITRDALGAADWSDPVKGMQDFRQAWLKDPRKGSGQGFMAAQQHAMDLVKGTMGLTDEQHKQESYIQEQSGAALTAALNAPAESKQQAWEENVIPRWQTLHPGQQLPVVYPGDDKVQALMDTNNFTGKMLAMRKTVAETAEAKQKTAESVATTALTEAKAPGEKAKSDIEIAKAAAMKDMAAHPEKLMQRVDAAINPAQFPPNLRAAAQSEHDSTYAQALGDIQSGLGMEAVDKRIADGADRAGRLRAGVAQAQATAPIKIYTATETERQKNKLTELSPESLDMAAEYFRKTGAMPQGISRNKLAVSQIMKRAGEMGPVDLASDKIAFAANQASLTGLVKNRDAVAAFENTAGKNLDLFLKAAQPVIDSGSPWINTPLRAVDQKALGNTDLPAFQAARQVAINEIAKVTGNPGLSGQLSDSARKEVESFIPANATLGQIYSVAKILKQDMANRHDSYNEQIAEIQKRVGGAPATLNAPEKPATTKQAIGGYQIGHLYGNKLEYLGGDPNVSANWKQH